MEYNGEEFKIKGDDWEIILKIDETWDYPTSTCFWGGYDTFSSIYITSPHYSARGQFCISTGEIYNFFKEFSVAYRDVSGTAELKSYEKNLHLKLVFNNHGHVLVTGNFIAETHIESELMLAFQTDQSFLKETLLGLQAIHRKYGDNSGIKMLGF